MTPAELPPAKGRPPYLRPGWLRTGYLVGAVLFLLDLVLQVVGLVFFGVDARQAVPAGVTGLTFGSLALSLVVYSRRVDSKASRASGQDR